MSRQRTFGGEIGVIVFHEHIEFWLLFSCPVVSDLHDPMELQHTRLPCPSLSHGVHSNSWPLSRWCQSMISSSVTPFSCPQSFPVSKFFQQLFISGGQSIGASASASVLPMSIQGWFPSELAGLIFLLSKGLSRVFSSTTIWKHSAFFMVHSHIHTWLL